MEGRHERKGKSDHGEPDASASEEEGCERVEDDEQVNEQHNNDCESAERADTHKNRKKVHKLSLTATQDFNEKLRKRGVIYVARVPPRMNPTKIKSLLGDFGTVTRVFLKEEDATRRKQRRKATGNGTKRYVEGWVEFEDKKLAKHVARSLNNTPISIHKRNVHFGDLWNLKYLNKFKWSHLTEKVAYERRVREQKLRVEMLQARRENASYTQLVETGQKLDKIEERKRKRSGEFVELSKKKRTHRQTKPIDEGTKKAAKRAVLNSLV